MTKRMLVDATHPEETRVAIVNSYRDTNKLEDLDFGLASKPILRGNIYLAKVMRIEPSLQAAFVEYGGNRHGFLPFSEIHPDYFRIPVADRPHGEEEDEPEAEMESGADQPEDIDGDDGYEPDDNGGDGGDGDAIGEEPVSYGAQEEAVPPPALEPAPFPEQPGLFGSADTHEGLITDFGNAVVTPVSMTEVPAAPVHVESVGGDLAERMVRRHRPRYKIQEVLKRGQVMLIQVVKEERGNKGAALTSFLSLAGRYCVLMPNTDHGGGVSRKITNHQDRRRMKEILDQLEIPEGMAVILRTAGMEQAPPEIQRDLEYLLRLWDSIREQTLRSNAPALIYEEANLIKRSVRDLFTQDIGEILVAGADGYNRAREFMSALMPDQVDKIRLYEDPIPLFFRYHVENQIDKLHSPVVQLRSGGYIVINPTEALVAIDVNSGRATRERHIEETALKTNIEAADEVARQLRLRDLAGLIVIDFIDMEDGRNNAAVERRLKEAMKNDRARLQIGRISPFGLLELSRQRLRPSLLEINFEKCPHCVGTGYIRSVDSASLSVLRAIEEEGIRQRGSDLTFHVPSKVALYLLNQKRDALHEIEQRYDLRVLLHGDDAMVPPDYRLERSRSRAGGRKGGAPAVDADEVLAETERALQTQGEESAAAPEESRADPIYHDSEPDHEPEQETAGEIRENNDFKKRRFRQRGRGGSGGRRERPAPREQTPFVPFANDPAGDIQPVSFQNASPGETAEFIPPPQGQALDDQDPMQRRRRRGRRGGKRRGNGGEGRFNQQGDRGPRKERFGGRKPGYGQGFGDEPAAPAYPPVSALDLDTTPRLDTAPRMDIRPPAMSAPRNTPAPATPQASARSHDERPASKPASSPAQAFSSPYEIVNPPAGKPKGGWWKKLTGQE